MAANTLGEWCREVMLTSANGQPAKATRAADEFHVLMAEVVALRAILLNMLFKQRGTADSRGHAAAHRPGRLGQTEGGARKAGTRVRP